MAKAIQTKNAREPWEGYEKQTPDERAQLLEQKVEAARQQGDYAYAYALASAVANYERVQELQPDTTHSEPVAVKARDLHDLAGSWIGS
jgi:hypothetical protein